MNTATSQNKRDLLQGMLILAVGILAGVLLPVPEHWFSKAAASEKPTAELLRHPLAPAESPPPPAKNGLISLDITLADKDALALQQARNKALESVISTDKTKMWLPAEVRLNGKKARARVRLKGDLYDHVRSAKWSLRVELLDDKLEGMSTFSIQQPETRGYMWEWLVLRAARDENLLAPYSTFVNVSLNNNPNGIYYLEEHTTKEFLESQQRREGPIVRYSDDNYWETQLRNHLRTYTSPISADAILVAFEPDRTTAIAFDEKRMNTIDTLNRQLHSAIEKMRTYQAKMMSERRNDQHYTRLLAFERSQGKILEDVFDMQQLAKAHALLTLFQGGHALLWVNQRYYHNPVTERLEPIVFDTNSQQPEMMLDLAISNPLLKVFTRSHLYKNYYFEEVGMFSSNAYLETLFEKYAQQLQVFETALREDNELPDGYQVEAMKNRLRGRQIHLHQILYPVHPANFKTDLVESDNSKRIEVEAWATTKVPVIIDSFRFSNGVILDAADVLQESRFKEVSIQGKSVIIHGSGDHTRFSFDVDQRLEKLRDVKEIKKAIRLGSNEDKSVKLDIKVRYRPMTSTLATNESLVIRRKVKGADPNEGRPNEPDLDTFLAHHDFITYDLNDSRLNIPAGTHAVQGDLVLPSRTPLNIEAGAQLTFSPGAAFVTSGPIFSEGTQENPIRLVPASAEEGWGGLVVLSSPDMSRFAYTEIHKTTGLARGGWVLTGGVTFYRSPLTAHHMMFDGNRAEDALNVISARVDLDNILVRNCSSDAFDGDFISGDVRNSTFSHCAGDGVDTSGSDVIVTGCVFSDIGDKAVSIGENSHAILRDNQVERAMIGVAAKDKSQVIIENLSVQSIRNYVLASYIKKKEYGASTMTVTGLNGQYQPGQLLNMEGCSMTVDGKNIPGQMIDVPKLYKEQKLGN
jgi:hypothetical protein